MKTLVLMGLLILSPAATADRELFYTNGVRATQQSCIYAVPGTPVANNGYYKGCVSTSNRSCGSNLRFIPASARCGLNEAEVSWSEVGLGPKIAFSVGGAVSANQLISANNITKVDFDTGSGFFNHGNAFDVNSDQFTTTNGVYQFNLVIGYESANPSAVLQVFLRDAGGFIARSDNNPVGTASGSITLSAVTNGLQVVFVEVVSSSDFQVSKFTSRFSGHLVYSN
jgi:hypothetical protein